MEIGTVLLVGTSALLSPTKLSTIFIFTLASMDFYCLKQQKIEVIFFFIIKSTINQQKSFAFLILFLFFLSFFIHKIRHRVIYILNQCCLVQMFIFRFIDCMEKQLMDLRKKYEDEADRMATKPRFGYFSIYPPQRAAKTDFKKTQCRKTRDGRVNTEARNIYGGSTASGVLKKSYFSIPHSIYTGDPFEKRKEKTKVGNDQKKPLEKKQVFRPIKVNKTLSTPAYNYICEKQHRLDPKNHRNADGSVITKERNICSNSLSKIAYEKDKSFQYLESDYNLPKTLKKQQLLKSLLMRKSEPFRRGSPGKEYFQTNVEAFNDHTMKIKRVNRNSAKILRHENPFKPSCRPFKELFSKFKDEEISIPSGQMTKKENCTPDKRRVSTEIGKKQPFRLTTGGMNSKPSPSITCSKINFMKKELR